MDWWWTQGCTSIPMPAFYFQQFLSDWSGSRTRLGGEGSCFSCWLQYFLQSPRRMLMCTQSWEFWMWRHWEPRWVETTDYPIWTQQRKQFSFETNENRAVWVCYSSITFQQTTKSLREHQFMKQHVCRLDVQHGSKIRCQQHCSSFLGLIEENTFPDLFQLLDVAHTPCLLACFLHLWSWQSCISGNSQKSQSIRL